MALALGRRKPPRSRGGGGWNQEWGDETRVGRGLFLVRRIELLRLLAAADLDAARLGRLRLGERQGQHAIGEGRVHLFELDREGQRERAGELAVVELAQVPLLALGQLR